MVKKVELSDQYAGYTALALFELVYGGDGTFLRYYHRKVNDDPDASVGDWEADQRTVSFTTPVDAPAMIKRVIGKDAMRVVETQQRTYHPDGRVTLLSKPVADMPGGSKFCTEAAIDFSDAPGGGGCQIRAVVTCSASGPYGLAGTIETFMVEAGRKSVREFLDAVREYAQAPEAALAAAATAALPAADVPVPIPAAAPAATGAAAGGSPAAAAPAAPAPSPPPQLPEPLEVFWDARELPMPLPAYVKVAAATGGEVPYEDAALLYMRYMCRTGDQTVGLLQALELQVRSLRSEVAQLRQAAEEQRQQQLFLPQLPETISTRRALLCAALLASSTAGAALMWSRRSHIAAQQ